MCRPMGRRTETSMAPSSRRQRLATLAADRVIDAVLALATLSTSLGTTPGRGSGAHNICAGHGSCARLLAADGPKLGQGRRPNLGIGAQDERLATELDRAQSAGTYLLIRRLTADPVGITEVFERESSSVHFQFASCLWWWSRSRPPIPTYMGRFPPTENVRTYFLPDVFACAPIFVAR